MDYDLQPLQTIDYGKDTRIEKIFGTVEFGPNDKEKQVFFKVYKRSYHETDFD